MLKSLSLKNVTLRKFGGAHELYAEFPHCGKANSTESQETHSHNHSGDG